MRAPPLLSLLVVLPALGALVLRGVKQPEAQRRLALGVTATTLVLTGVVLALFQMSPGGPQLQETGGRVPGLGLVLRLGVDGMSVLALPLAALLTLGLVAAGPRQSLDARTLGVLLLTESLTLGFFCAEDLLLMCGLFIGSVVPAGRLIWRDVRSRPEARALRTFRTYMVAGTLPLLGVLGLVGGVGWSRGAEAPFGLAELTAQGMPPAWRGLLFALLMLAVCVRMAVVPFHSWLPVLVARGPFGLSSLLVNVHAGLYLVVRVVMPLLPDAWRQVAPALGALGLGSALYGAVLAMAQTDLRRMVGFLVVSQSGMLLTGLALGNPQGLAGALLHSVAAGIALTGLNLVVRALEARTGSADVTRLGGLVRRAPRMAAFFLLMGCASLGFPGTLSFVGEDLLLHGSLGAHPLVALPLLLTTAINGVLLLRAFQRAFLGTPAHGQAPVLETVQDLLPRERWAVFALFILMLLGGMVPQPLLRLRAPHVDALVARVAGSARAE